MTRDLSLAGKFFGAVIIATVGLTLYGCSDSSSVSQTTAPTSFTITSGSPLPTGFVGIAYSPLQLASVLGVGTVTWSIDPGSPQPLPAGLNLTPQGVLSGTPTTPTGGQIVVRVRAQDSSQPAPQVTTKDFGITVSQVPQPTITTPSPLPNGIQNQPYSATTLTAVGGTPPYTWSAVVIPPLPAGLTFNAATATISGTPTVTETNVTHTFSVTDSFFPTPQTVSKGLALTVSAAPLPLTITTGPPQGGPLPGGTVTQAYGPVQFTATGGTAPLTWDLNPGSPALPAGLTLSSTGVLSGTPSAATTVTPVFRVRDSATSPQQTATKPLTITIGLPAPPIITTTSLPPGSFNTAYNQTVNVSGGIAPLTWGVISGGLPTGLSLNSSNGAITGTATATGTFLFTVRVTDNIPQIDDQDLSITIAAPSPPSITAPASLPVGTVNVAYGPITLTAAGGAPPLNFSPVVTPALPNGLIWTAATATISGTPLAGSNGTTNHTFTVNDSTLPTNQTGTRNYSLTINLPAPPNITTTSASLLPNGTVNQAYSRTLQRTGGTAPFTWSFTGTLPTGLTLNTATGEISGIPTVANTFNFTPQVTDALSQTDPTPPALSITIGAAPTPPDITTTSASLLPNGTVNQAYSRTLQRTGGTAPFTWSFTGTLPTGLTLNTATGEISGIPTVANTFNFTPQVTDALLQTDPTPPNLSITITP